MFDAEIDAVLAEQGLSRGAVPAAGQTVLLRKMRNVSMESDSADVTGHVPDGFITAIEKVWAGFRDRAVPGIDVIVPDVTHPPDSPRRGVTEVSNRPEPRVARRADNRHRARY